MDLYFEHDAYIYPIIYRIDCKLDKDVYMHIKIYAVMGGREGRAIINNIYII